ncbi:MAG: hypothetical protein QOF51_3587 [Chloroflexota bacterium]|jgi:hypothetical protein|nr:hypothetical protein [Chloroflexota bacterium]
MMLEPIPTLDDLTLWARRSFERAYEQSGFRRPRCSKEDFAAGYLAAVMNLRVWSVFTEEAQGRLKPPTSASA